MVETKKRILNTARLLFNQHGYFKVTIRMIAQALNMSSGNLNYHFKTRKAILSALYFEMTTVFDERVDNITQQELSLQFVSESIIRSMQQMLDYEFIWTDLYHILKEDEAIFKHFQMAYEKRLLGYNFLFQSLQQQGIMQPESYPNEYQSLAIRMIHFSNHWITNASYYNDDIAVKNTIHYHGYLLLEMLFPYLSKKGKQHFLELKEKLDF